MVGGDVEDGVKDLDHARIDVIGQRHPVPSSNDCLNDAVVGEQLKAAGPGDGTGVLGSLLATACWHAGMGTAQKPAPRSRFQIQKYGGSWIALPITRQRSQRLVECISRRDRRL